jgi:hypothetical protein
VTTRRVEVQLEAQAVTTAVSASKTDQVVVCDSLGYSDGLRRVIVVATGSNGFVILADGWIRDRSEVLSWLNPSPRFLLRTGSCDAYFSTPPRRCWTTGRTPFALWTRRRIAFEVDQGEVRLPRHTLSVADVESVESFARSGWLRLGVRLCLVDGSKVVVAAKRNPFGALDFTYDGIDLMGDMAWAEALAESLGECMGVPVASTS